VWPLAAATRRHRSLFEIRLQRVKLQCSYIQQHHPSDMRRRSLGGSSSQNPAVKTATVEGFNNEGQRPPPTTQRPQLLRQSLVAVLEDSITPATCHRRAYTTQWPHQ
jgi:hypothetical protein